MRPSASCMPNNHLDCRMHNHYKGDKNPSRVACIMRIKREILYPLDLLTIAVFYASILVLFNSGNSIDCGLIMKYQDAVIFCSLIQRS